jgi:hypothetical protein
MGYGESGAARWLSPHSRSGGFGVRAESGIPRDASFGFLPKRRKK